MSWNIVYTDRAKQDKLQTLRQISLLVSINGGHLQTMAGACLILQERSSVGKTKKRKR